jgi:hypothetical protein
VELAGRRDWSLADGELVTGAAAIPVATGAQVSTGEYALVSTHDRQHEVGLIAFSSPEDSLASTSGGW